MSHDAFLGLINDAVDAQGDRMCAEAGQLSLGELAARLAPYNPELTVAFSDGSSPGDLDSYRGYYRYIAIEHGDPCTVGDLLPKIEAAIGATFTGYKGGEFKMSRMTPVWVSNYGEASGDGVVGVSFDGQKVILQIARIEED